MESQVPSVLNPYRDTALEYRKAGFFGPLPIPYKKKDPVPVDTNKLVSKYPTVEKIEEWRALGQRNICVRLAGVDKEHELMGIDVDDYLKGAKKKEGASQLLRLENKLGKLPETWISSARIDGKSGIRYFRVPRGLQFRGKVDKDIEVIRKGHRYAMVWPSLHPDGGTYWWFPPGINPDKEGKSAWNGSLPNAREFPFLPDPWIDYLTNDRMLAPDDEVIDIDSSVQEIYDWATDTFHGDDESPPCFRMRQKLDLHLKKLETTATFHDLLTNAHWNIVKLSFEGHVGWNEAINEYENAFCEAVAKRGGGTTDRDLPTLHKEIFRSRVQALRKIKGDSDKRLADSAAPVDACCQVIGACSPNPQGLSVQFNVDESASGNGTDTSRDGTSEPPGEFDDIPKGPTGPIEDFELNDDGNALHFYKYFTNLNTGPSFHWVEGYGWIIWHAGINGISEPRWERDEDGTGQIRRMWQEIKKRQIDHAENLQIAFYTNLAAANQTGNVTVSGNPIPGSSLAMDKAVMVKMTDWAERSGNVRQVDHMLQALKHLPGVSVDINKLNSNRLLLGVSNGVVELDRHEVRLRPATQSDLITMNTGVPWEKPSNHAMNLWQEYLDLFLPDKELQHAVKIIFGHSLIGGNPEKKFFVLIGEPNTGKSTMLSGVIAALGDYAQTVNESAFQSSRFNEVLATSLDKRFIACSEFSADVKLSAAMIKRMTGNDEITQSIKFSNAVKTGSPQFIPFLATNSMPGIDGADAAFEYRMKVIPFKVSVEQPKSEQQNVIETVCKTAILNWMIEGFIEYRQLGKLPENELINEQSEESFSDLDDVGTFLRECVKSQTSPEKYISRKAMYERFEQWQTENRTNYSDRISMSKFTRILKSKNLKTRNTRFRVDGVLDHWWIGVKFEKTSPNVISMASGKPLVSFNVRQDDGSETDKNTP